MSRKAAYVPERGDAVWITLDPQAGHEQAGRRPALVLSPSAYNGRVGLALVDEVPDRLVHRAHHPLEPPEGRREIRGVVNRRARQANKPGGRREHGAREDRL